MLFRLKDYAVRLLTRVSLITRLRRFFSSEYGQAWDRFALRNSPDCGRTLGIVVTGVCKPRRTRKRDSIARTVSAPRTWAIITPHAFVREEMPMFPPFSSLCHNFPSRTSSRAHVGLADESLLLAARLQVAEEQRTSFFRAIHCREVKKNEGLKRGQPLAYSLATDNTINR